MKWTDGGIERRVKVPDFNCARCVLDLITLHTGCNRHPLHFVFDLYCYARRTSASEGNLYRIRRVWNRLYYTALRNGGWRKLLRRWRECCAICVHGGTVDSIPQSDSEVESASQSSCVPTGSADAESGVETDSASLPREAEIAERHMGPLWIDESLRGDFTDNVAALCVTGRCTDDRINSRKWTVRRNNLVIPSLLAEREVALRVRTNLYVSRTVCYHDQNLLKLDSGIRRVAGGLFRVSCKPISMPQIVAGPFQDLHTARIVLDLLRLTYRRKAQQGQVPQLNFSHALYIDARTGDLHKCWQELLSLCVAQAWESIPSQHPCSDAVQCAVNAAASRHPLQLVQAIRQWRMRNQKCVSQHCISCSRIFLSIASTYDITPEISDLVRGVDPNLADSPWPELGAGCKNVLCKDCFRAFRRSEYPVLHPHEGCSLPEIPHELAGWDLTPAEWRQVAPLQVFQSIVEHPVSHRLRLHGASANVLVDTVKCANILPRRLTDPEGDICLAYRRKLKFHSGYRPEMVRPAAITTACEVLEGKPVYEKLGVTFGIADWESHVESLQEQCRMRAERGEEEVVPPTVGREEYNETRTEMHSMVHDCESAHLLEQLVFGCAPGEMQDAISIVGPKFAYELAFPELFYGEFLPENKLTERGLVKWLLYHRDRRFATVARFIFLAYHRIIVRMMISQRNIMVRQGTYNDLCSVDWSKDGEREDLLRQDKMYRLFADIQGTPGYMATKRTDALALVRQFGMPTFMITLSHGDLYDMDLLNCIAQWHKCPEVTDDTPIEEREALISRDPVISAMHFYNRYKTFLKRVLTAKDGNGLLPGRGEYFDSVEAQHRGALHAHLLHWMEGAPQYGVEPLEQIIEFIDQYITCAWDSTIPDKVKLRQVHRHRGKCNHRKGTPCQYGYPKPPFPETLILTPLDEEEDLPPELSLCKLHETWKKIMEHLEALENPHTLPEEVPFQTWLDTVGVDYSTYVLAVRSHLQKDTVFLRRTVNEVYVNNYNREILLLWEFNMDIQYVLNPHACITYLTSYLCKGNEGKSKMLGALLEAARSGDRSAKQFIRRAGESLVRTREISLIAATADLLGHSLIEMSTEVVYVDGRHKNYRSRILKSQKDLEKLQPGEDMCHTGPHERYLHRDPEMESICKADFFAWYSKKTIASTPLVPEVDGEQIEEQDEQEAEEDQEILECEASDGGLSCESYHSGDYEVETSISEHSVHVEQNPQPEQGAGQECPAPCGSLLSRFNPPPSFPATTERYTRRRKPRVIRSNPVKADPGDMLEWRLHMARLFHPYRSDDEICPEMIQRHWEQWEPGILEAAGRHMYNIETLTLLSDAVRAALQNPEHTHLEQELKRRMKRRKETNFEFASPLTKTYPRIVPPEVRHAQNAKLNRGQLAFRDQIMTRLKTQPLRQLRLFLTGSAGTGKTYLIKCLIADANHYFCSLPGTSPDRMKVLVLSPQNKGAYLCDGLTIHSGLHMGFVLTDNSDSVVNRLRNLLSDVQLIIVDEISLAGADLLRRMQKRLTDIKLVSKPMGGYHFIFVGDFFQLPPVLDRPCFRAPVEAPLVNVWRKSKIRLYELTEIMRQREHLKWAQVLNRMREDKLTEEDHELLLSRTNPANWHNEEDALMLMYSNNAVDAYNEERLHAKDGEYIEHQCEDKPNKEHRDPESLLKRAKLLKHGPAQFLYPEFRTKKGMIVTLEHKVGDDLVKGLSGIVRAYDLESRHIKRRKLWVEFSDENAGTSLKGLHDTHREWVPISPVTATVQVGRGEHNTVERTQFPVRSGPAKTFYKAQGETAKAGHIDFHTTDSKKVARRVSGACYVVFSRFMCSSRVNLRHWRRDTIYVATRVKRFMEKMRQPARRFRIRSVVPASAQTSFVLNNVNHWKSHESYATGHYGVQSADVAFFVETHTTVADQTPVGPKGPGGLPIFPYCYVHRSTAAPSHSMIVFGKHPLQKIKILDGKAYCMLLVNVLNISYACIYRRPQGASTPQQFLDKLTSDLLELSSFPDVVLGDFNIDALAMDLRFTSYTQHVMRSTHWNTSPNVLRERLESYGYVQQVTVPTHRKGRALDHVWIADTFLENKSVSVSVQDAYWSDHAMVFGAIGDVDQFPGDASDASEEYPETEGSVAGSETEENVVPGEYDSEAECVEDRVSVPSEVEMDPDSDASSSSTRYMLPEDFYGIPKNRSLRRFPQYHVRDSC